MDLTGAGTTIMLVLAAALWFLYLVPTWIRRREYLATERTATRLQQTIRIMAESSEVPESVRFAATAREAVRAERLMRARQKRADAMVARQVRLERAATPSVPRVERAPLARPAADAVRRQRMRRTRRLSSGLMTVGTTAALVQLWLMMTTGVVVGSWLVLVAAFSGVVVAVVTQQRLDARSMPKAERRAAMAGRAERPLQDLAPMRAPAAVLVAPVPWTPVPVPQPLYLSRSVAEVPAAASAGVDAATRLRAAAARDEQAARRAHLEPEVSAMPGPAAPTPSAAPSRFARMGFIEVADEAPDLDEMLRRRRSAS